MLFVKIYTSEKLIIMDTPPMLFVLASRKPLYVAGTFITAISRIPFKIFNS